MYILRPRNTIYVYIRDEEMYKHSLSRFHSLFILFLKSGPLYKTTPSSLIGVRGVLLNLKSSLIYIAVTHPSLNVEQKQ